MRIYVGYDTREKLAYDVCKYSIHKHNPDIEVLPLKLKTMRELGIYTRDVDAKASTEFTFSRFFVPYLMDYKGWAMFVDCDFLFMSDPREVFDLANKDYAVQVVKHDYKPKNTTKMDGKKQEIYPRKNWSSCVLWNCGHPMNMRLSLQNLNTESGMWHHRFMWLEDSEIGEIPHHWNYLTDWYTEPDDGKPKALHYTEGGPWFEHMKDCEYAKQWTDTRDEMFRKLGIV